MCMEPLQVGANTARFWVDTLLPPPQNPRVYKNPSGLADFLK